MLRFEKSRSTSPLAPFFIRTPLRFPPSPYLYGMQKILQNSTTVTIYLLLILVVFRLLTDTLEWDWGLRIYALLLASVLACFVGIRNQRLAGGGKEEFTFVMDLKAGLRPGALLAILYSIFTFAFYKFINPAFFVQQREQRREELMEGLAEQEASAEQTEQVLQNFEAITDYVFAPFNWSTFTLFGLVALAGIYSLILTGLVRQFPQLTQH